MKYVGILPSAADRGLYSRFHLVAKGMAQKSFLQDPRGLKHCI